MPPFRAWPNRPTPFSVGRFGDGTIGVLYGSVGTGNLQEKDVLSLALRLLGDIDAWGHPPAEALLQLGPVPVPSVQPSTFGGRKLITRNW